MSFLQFALAPLMDLRRKPDVHMESTAGHKTATPQPSPAEQPRDGTVQVTDPPSPLSGDRSDTTSPQDSSPPSSGHIDSAQRICSSENSPASQTLEDSQEQLTLGWPEEQPKVGEQPKQKAQLGSAELHTEERAKPRPRQQTFRRVRRPCPIPECKGASFSNMWNHIFQTHRKRGGYTRKQCCEGVLTTLSDLCFISQRNS